MVNKSILRQEMLNRLGSLTMQDRAAYESDFKSRLVDYIQERGFKKVGVYYSFKPELSTHSLINYLMKQGIQVYLPIIGPNRHMAYAPYRSTYQMENIKGKVWQPATSERIHPDDLEMVLVPGLAYTKAGYRLGFGGGYFDRFLSEYPTLHTVSVALWDQVSVALEAVIEDHDQPVKNLILIPKREVFHESSMEKN